VETGVPCSDDNILVLCQPTFETPVSYWNSMHDLMLFWQYIIGKTFIIPGRALVALFEATVENVMNLKDLQNVNLDVGVILTQFMPREFNEAMTLTLNQFDTIIAQRIREMQILELKKFRLKTLSYNKRKRFFPFSETR
jgi:hypothetical protein